MATYYAERARIETASTPGLRRALTRVQFLGS